MSDDNYTLLHPHRHRDSVTVGRKRAGNGYIYISIGLKERLGLKNKIYCYIHKRRNRLLLSFTDEPKFPGYRMMRQPYSVIRVSGTLLKNYLKEGERIRIPPHVEDGNIIVDLERLKEMNGKGKNEK